MAKLEIKELLEAGVHFGHLKRKWNPNMAPYIFMERSGIHVIDLQKTQAKLEEATNAIRQIARSGRKILFVATKKQAKDIVAEKVQKVDMPYVTERWPGGMLTNFPTIRKSIKKMATIDKMTEDGSYDNLSKRERLHIQRQRAKLDKNFGSIADMNRLPSALFVIDVSKEYIAVREANKLNIPVFGIVDTNSDPREVSFPIPANDDASKSISLLVDNVCKAIEEGLEERKLDKDKDGEQEEAAKKEKKTAKKKVTKAKPEGQKEEEATKETKEEKEEKQEAEPKKSEPKTKKAPARKKSDEKEVAKSSSDDKKEEKKEDEKEQKNQKVASENKEKKEKPSDVTKNETKTEENKEEAAKPEKDDKKVAAEEKKEEKEEKEEKKTN